MGGRRSDDVTLDGAVPFVVRGEVVELGRLLREQAISRTLYRYGRVTG